MVELAENDDFIDGFRELPTSEDKKMGANSSGSVAIPLSGWVPNIFAILPLHFLGAPYLKVFTLFFL